MVDPEFPIHILKNVGNVGSSNKILMQMASVFHGDLALPNRVIRIVCKQNVVDGWNTSEPLLNLVVSGRHLQTRYTTKVTTRRIISHLLVLRFKSR